MELLDDEVSLLNVRLGWVRVEGCRVVVCKFSCWMEIGMLVYDDGFVIWE